MATRPAAPLRSAIVLHRWIGVALCIVFTTWFATGIVLMYWDFPEVTAADRLAHAAVLDPSRVKLSAQEAYAALGESAPPKRVVLNSFDGRPVYRFSIGDSEAIVYADDGTRQSKLSQEMIRRAAAGWAGPSAGVAVERPVFASDQWTLEAELRTVRPLWKYEFADGQQVYVSGVSGEVVQYTTSESRFWSYLGAIPHFLYFAPVRRHVVAWTRMIIVVSGIATLAVLLGLVIGVARFSPSKRYRHAGTPSHIPYRGPKRWHNLLGLFIGVFACTWAFSGMMSVEPFPVKPSASAEDRKIPDALRGGGLELAAFAPRGSRDALLAVGESGVKELELTTVTGEAMYVATDGTGRNRFVAVRGAPFDSIGRDRVIDAMRRAALPAQLDIRVLTQYDAYYRDRKFQLPLPVLLVTERGSDSARWYVDPIASRVVGGYHSADWVNRWLYHGLHSLDFPWLYDHRPLWDIVVITLLLGGTALSVTSLILAWRVVRRRISPYLRETEPDTRRTIS